MSQTSFMLMQRKLIIIIILYSEINPETEDPEVILLQGLLPNYI